MSEASRADRVLQGTRRTLRSTASVKATLQEEKFRQEMVKLSERTRHCASQLDNQITNLIGISNKIISFAKKIVSYWRKSVCLHTENTRKLIET
jgi:hypothetical protein